jgi:glycine cleavage system aminomethyltransferase T
MLLVILVYPALATGTVSILFRSEAISKADHVYVNIGNFWAHRSGRTSSEGWELIINQTQTLDLVSLQSTTLQFGKGQISLGSYDSVRMDISNVTWVFNKTTTKLQVQFSQIEASLGFTVQAGKELPVTVMLSGHQEDISGINYFLTSANATLGGP